LSALSRNPGNCRNCHNDEKWICPLIKKTLFTCSDKHKTVTELSNELTGRLREGEDGGRERRERGRMRERRERERE
jgi:hypothetical protein